MFKFTWQFLGSIQTWHRWFDRFEDANDLRERYKPFTQWSYIEEFSGD